MRIEILLYDGFDELDALGPYEVLRAASAAGAGLRTELARLGSATVTSARGLTLHVPRLLDPEHPPALLLVPGGGWIARSDHGAFAEMQRGRIAPVVSRLHAGGTVMAAVCTGSMLLAAAGILAGRPATTHRRAMNDLAASGAEVVPARVVDDGDVVTSAGVTSGLDLALWLVERFATPAIAHQVERELEYERRGTVWRRRPDPLNPEP